MSNLSRRFLSSAALALAASAACVRYELVDQTCPALEPEYAQSAIAWQRAGPAGSVSGHVTTLPDGAPSRDTRIWIGNRWHYADSLGRVVIGSVPRGADTLRIQRLGYMAAFAGIDIHGDTGVVFAAVMAAVRLRETDGCGFDREKRRKPWWKVW